MSPTQRRNSKSVSRAMRSLVKALSLMIRFGMGVLLVWIVFSRNKVA